jgi:hypothetical protein
VQAEAWRDRATVEEADMHPSRRVITAGALAAGVVLTGALLLPGAVASAGSSDGNAQHGDRDERTLQFDVHFSPFNYTDLGRPGPSAADVIVFHDTLLRHGQKVGDEVGSCVLVDPSGLSNCTAVIRLGDDTLTYSLVNAPPPRKSLAITGGSGSYRTAHGDGVLVEHGDAANTGTLTLRVITT